MHINLSGEVSTLAGCGEPGYTDATGLNAQFAHPTAIAFSTDGNVYVCDENSRWIRRITWWGANSISHTIPRIYTPEFKENKKENDNKDAQPDQITTMFTVGLAMSTLKNVEALASRSRTAKNEDGNIVVPDPDKNCISILGTSIAVYVML